MVARRRGGDACSPVRGAYILNPSPENSQLETRQPAPCLHPGNLNPKAY